MAESSWSVFDVIGPVMVGPSSSHTAGAARIGYFARIINGERPERVKILLHGSFGKVYEGHCTDLAIIGGLLGYLPHSDKIQNAREEAKVVGMSVKIMVSNLGDTVHPNSVRIEMKNKDGSIHRVRAKSIGGGKIVIREIDKIGVHIDMSYSCLIVIFNNRSISALDIIEHVKNFNVNIHSFDTSNYKDISMVEVQILEHYSSDIIHQIEKINGVKYARYLNHITNYQHYCD